MASKVVMAGAVPEELAEAARRVYVERTGGQLPVSPSAVVRYALAALAGMDAAAAAPLRMGRPPVRREARS